MAKNYARFNKWLRVCERFALMTRNKFGTEEALKKLFFSVEGNLTTGVITRMAEIIKANSPLSPKEETPEMIASYYYALCA